MQIEILTLENGWLVRAHDGRYLGSGEGVAGKFCSTKEEIAEYLLPTIKTAEQLQQEELERRKQYETEKALCFQQSIAGGLAGAMQG